MIQTYALHRFRSFWLYKKVTEISTSIRSNLKNNWNDVLCIMFIVMSLQKGFVKQRPFLAEI